MKSSTLLSPVIIFTLLFSVSCNKESYVTVRPVEYEHALNNPLKGFRPSLGGYHNRTYEFGSIQRSYIKWNELENNEADGIEKIRQVCNEKWKGLEETFNIDVPEGTYILSLAILDPAGYLPSLRFATVNYLMGGRHPLGRVDVRNRKCSPLPENFSFDDPAMDHSLHYILTEN